MPEHKILIAGATGYIGGSVLTSLLANNNEQNYSFSALIRDAKQASKLNELGVKTIIFEGLDDLEVCEKAAYEHDVVINCAHSAHPASVKAWIRGLGRRQKETGQSCVYIHNAGTSAFGDLPVSKKIVDTTIYSDTNDAYRLEEEINVKRPYGQRNADIATVKTGEEFGVSTYIVMPPTIYGKGTGLFSTITAQTPGLIRLSLKYKQAITIGDGSAYWCNVHIQDLADLYVALLKKAVAGESIPSGRKGLYFAENGEHSWLEASIAIGKGMLAQGLASTAEVKHLSLKEAADALMGGDEDYCEIVMASNSRTRANLAREVLNWKPKYTKEDFLKEVEEEVRIVSTTESGEISYRAGKVNSAERDGKS